MHLIMVDEYATAVIGRANGTLAMNQIAHVC